MKKPSNISTIVQREKTGENIDHIENLVKKKENFAVGSGEITEPSSSFKNSKYGKIVVRELQKGKGIVQIIDNTEDNIRIYEIHPNGSYSSKTENNTVEKSTVEAFQIFTNGLKIAIDGDKIEVVKGNSTICIDKELNIETYGTAEIPKERLLSWSKVRELLLTATDSLQAPITYGYDPTRELNEDTMCFDKINITQKTK